MKTGQPIDTTEGQKVNVDPMVRTFSIDVVGCDATTTFSMDLTPEGFKAVFELAKLSHKNSSYGCMPVVKIEGHDMERCE